MKVELKPYPEMSNDRGEQKAKAFHVFVDGVRAGYIFKQENTRTCSFPYRAGDARGNFLANYFPAEGGKKAAVAAVVNAAKA